MHVYKFMRMKNIMNKEIFYVSYPDKIDVLQITRELHEYARRLNDEQQHLKRKDERKKLIILPLICQLEIY